MADFELDAFTKSVHADYERKLVAQLPAAKFGCVPDPDEQLSSLAKKMSSPIKFESFSVQIEWTPAIPEADNFADDLVTSVVLKVKENTIEDKEFERAPQVFVLHRAMPTNVFPGQARQYLATSENTCVLGQLWFDQTNIIEFRTCFAVCQYKPVEREELGYPR